MSTAVALRSVLRSTATRTISKTMLVTGTKSSSTRIPFRVPKQNPLSPRAFRSPVELSCCVESLLPYHTATASALLTSMLSVTCRASCWTPEDG